MIELVTVKFVDQIGFTGEECVWVNDHVCIPIAFPKTIIEIGACKFVVNVRFVSEWNGFPILYVKSLYRLQTDEVEKNCEDLDLAGFRRIPGITKFDLEMLRTDP